MRRFRPVVPGDKWLCVLYRVREVFSITAIAVLLPGEILFSFHFSKTRRKDFIPAGPDDGP